MIDLSVVILNWNVCDLLDRCLASIRSDRLQIETIVVDNASSDGSVAMVRSKYSHVMVLANSINRGFTGGNNRGIAASHGRYVMVLNPDTEIIGDALDRIIAFLDGHADVGALGPQLLDPDRSIQSSRRRFPTAATGFFESTWMQGIAPRSVLRRYYMDDVPPDMLQEVDWVTGACTIFRRSVLDQIGLYDEANFFMYSEELDLCRRMKAAAGRLSTGPKRRSFIMSARAASRWLSCGTFIFRRAKCITSVSIMDAWRLHHCGCFCSDRICGRSHSNRSRDCWAAGAICAASACRSIGRLFVQG